MTHLNPLQRAKLIHQILCLLLWYLVKIPFLSMLPNQKWLHAFVPELYKLEGCSLNDQVKWLLHFATRNRWYFFDFNLFHFIFTMPTTRFIFSTSLLGLSAWMAANGLSRNYDHLGSFSQGHELNTKNTLLLYFWSVIKPGPLPGTLFGSPVDYTGQTYHSSEVKE